MYLIVTFVLKVLIKKISNRVSLQEHAPILVKKDFHQ